MIKTRHDLNEYIKLDNSWYQIDDKKTHLIEMIKSSNGIAYKKYLVYLRKSEYHLNNSKGSRYHTYLSWYYERKKNKLGRKLGVEIYPNCFGKGLTIWHCGGIVVHPSARVGQNCILHGGNCIGNKGTDDEYPVLGDNVDLGYGASVFGDITIASNTIIGANAVVVKSVMEPGKIIVGVPGKEIK